MRFGSDLKFLLVATLLTAHVSQAEVKLQPYACPSVFPLERGGIFDANHVFSGEFAIPAYLYFYWRYQPSGKKIYVRTGEIAKLPQSLQTVIATLKHQSLAHPHMLFREYGAFYHYNVGQGDASEYFTSHHTTAIAMKVQNQKVQRSKFLDPLINNPLDTGAVYHLHTHPGPALRKGTPTENMKISLAPSKADYEAYQWFADSFLMRAKRKIPLIGMVIPMAPGSEEIYFEVKVDPDPHLLDLYAR